MTEKQEQVENQDLKCVLVVGLKADGGVFVETHGNEPNLVTLDGLIEYAKRYVQGEWTLRTEESLKNKMQNNSFETTTFENETPAEEVEVELVK